jgi:hypothetical protein
VSRIKESNGLGLARARDDQCSALDPYTSYRDISTMDTETPTLVPLHSHPLYSLHCCQSIVLAPFHPPRFTFGPSTHGSYPTLDVSDENTLKGILLSSFHLPIIHAPLPDSTLSTHRSYSEHPTTYIHEQANNAFTWSLRSYRYSFSRYVRS